MRKASYLIRPATAADLHAFYGKAPPASVRVLAVEYHGRLAAIAGIRLERGGCVLFSDMSHNVRAPKITIYRCARDLAATIRAWGVPAYCVGNDRLFQKLGFIPSGIHQNHEIYRI